MAVTPATDYSFLNDLQVTWKDPDLAAREFIAFMYASQLASLLMDNPQRTVAEVLEHPKLAFAGPFVHLPPNRYLPRWHFPERRFALLREPYGFNLDRLLSELIHHASDPAIDALLIVIDQRDAGRLPGMIVNKPLTVIPVEL